MFMMKSVYEKSYILNRQVDNKLTFLTEKAETQHRRRHMQQESYDLPVRSRLWTPSVSDIQTIHLEDNHAQQNRTRNKSANAKIASGARMTVSALATHSKNDTTSKEKDGPDKKKFLAWSTKTMRLLSEKQATALTSKGHKLLSLTQISQEDDVVNDEHVQKGRLEQKRPLERFRKIVRLLMFILKVKTTVQRKSAQQKDTGVFAALHDEDEQGLRSLDGIHFDRRMFKAMKEVKLSKDAIEILSQEPGTRTEEQLQTALFALKASVPAFGEYPLKMQRKLLTVGWYESFEPKRIIIRQGHRAENFYFILSGTAIVTLLVRDGQTGEERSTTIAFLTKGSSFGELALLNHKTRSATVLCKDNVSLLAVGREDFRDIFMNYADGKEPDHISFLKTVPYFKNLPLDNLIAKHDNCIFHYFRRGAVIVRDSKTEWIYIVKTGSCRALTSLSKKKARLIQSAVKGTEPFLPLVTGGEYKRRCALYTAVGKTKAVVSCPYGERPVSEPPTSKRKANVVKNLSLPILVGEQGKLKKSAPKMDPFQERLVREACLRKIEELHQRKMNANAKSKPKEEQQVESQEKVFVQLAIFKPKDQFGLSTLLYDVTPVKCHLVSNGAECVLIKKSWFLQNTSEPMLRHLRSQIAPYPTQETLEQNLQDKANWDLYKSRTISDILDTLQIR